jgi:predicted MFS family arabinose efflux permease
VFVVAAFTGAVNAVDIPSRQSFLVEMVGRDDLMNAIALNSSIFNAARAVGPALAGLLITAAGTAACFFINGLSFLAVLAGLMFMSVECAPRREKPAYNVLKDIGEAIRYIRATPVLITTIFLVSVVSVFGTNFNVLVPVFSKMELHRDAAAFGLLMSSFGAGALIGSVSLAILSQWGPKQIILLGGGMGLSLFLTLIGLQRSFGLTALLLALSGLSMITFFGMANTTVQLNTEDRLRGRVMSLYILSFGGLTPFGSMFAGTVANWIKAPLTFALGGLICGAVFLVAILKRKKIAD